MSRVNENPSLCVLVTAIGSFSADRVIRELHDAGIRVIGCDIYPRQWIANSSLVDVFYHVALAHSKEYEIQLREIIQEEHVDYIFPLTDIEVDVLNGLRGTLESVVCISGADTIRVCRDKWKTFHILVPKFEKYLIPTRLLSNIKIDGLEYPVICKPINGRSSSGLFIAHNVRDFQYYRSTITDGDRYCVQPKIEGTVVTVDIVRSEWNDECVAIPRREFLRTPNGAGVSVEIFQNDILCELAKNIASELNINGCVNFEFIETPSHEYRFLECNPRFSGGISFSCIAGYNFVMNHLKCFLYESIDSQPRTRDMFIVKKYNEYVMD